MSENLKNGLAEDSINESVKELADALKKVSVSSEEIDLSGNEEMVSNFRVAGTNLPEKTSMWTKVKNALFYEIKVELSPYQQKIEKEINDFLHTPITWKSLKEAALSEVPITFRGKRVF